MKKLLLTYLTTLLLPYSLFCQIIETHHFNELYHYIEPSTLIILDIDNTLMEPAQTLGTDQWFYHRIQEYKSLGMNKQGALEKALSEWTAIQNITKVQLVEPGIDEIVADLQRRGYTVMGLTTRGLGLSTRTVEQLKGLNIDLASSGPTRDEIFFYNGQYVLFRGGILFTSGTHKGNAFCKLIDKINYHPHQILFINDKAQNIQELEESCLKRNIPFIGLRYGFIDEKVNNFDKQVADIQFQQFGFILSDEEAKALKE